MTRWRRYARWSGFGCEVCGRLRFAYGTLCRACASDDFDPAARAYVASLSPVELDALARERGTTARRQG